MVALDVKSAAGGVSFEFTSAKINYEYKWVSISYKQTNEDNKYHDIKCKMTDKDGTELVTTFGGGYVNFDPNGGPITQYSTIHIIYTVDGGDPITVTINIPGL